MKHWSLFLHPEIVVGMWDPTPTFDFFQEAGNYDEREYMILPPDGRGCIRLLDENQQLHTADEPAEQTETDEPPGQVNGYW